MPNRIVVTSVIVCLLAWASSAHAVAPNPPGRPSGSPNPSTGYVTVSWAASIGSSPSYRLQRSSDAQASWTTVVTTTSLSYGATYSSGTHYFRVIAVNSSGETSSPSSVSNAVRVSRSPTASDASYALDEDTQITITLVASDPDGDTLTYTVGSPSHGTLTGTGKTRVYKPNLNYAGTDSFTFTVSDGVTSTFPAKVSLTIRPVNDAPVATPQALSVNEDSALSIVLTGTDAENSSLSFTVQIQPAHGTLTGTPPYLTYRPAANYFGSDSFYFRARDGSLNSSPALVSITVRPVNDAPVAEGFNVSVDEGGQRTMTLLATDIEGDTLTFRIVTWPTFGSLSGAGDAFVYVPLVGFQGSDAFAYVANDGQADSLPVTVRIQVVNAPPTVTVVAPSLLGEGEIGSFQATGSDPGDAELTYLWDFGDGTTSTSRFATHAFLRDGSRTVTVTVEDGDGGRTVKTVVVNVYNRPPVVEALADQTVVDEGTGVAFDVEASDPGNDPLTFTWAFGDGQSGTGPSPTHVYTDDGSYEVRVIAEDDSGSTTSAWLRVVVRNVAPVASPQVVTAPAVEAAPVTFHSNAFDPGADPLTFQWTFSDGYVSNLSDPQRTFADDGLYTGSLRVDDGDGGSVTRHFEVAVQNASPTILAVNVPQGVVEGAGVELSVFAADPAGANDPLSVQWAFGDGSAAASGDRVVHAFAGHGTFQVTVVVSDDDGGEDRRTFDVEVGNAAPVPQRIDDLSVEAGEPLQVALSAVDPGGDPMTWRVVSGGGAIVDGATWLWTPPNDAEGQAFIELEVSDDSGASARVRFFVEVFPRDGDDDGILDIDDNCIDDHNPSQSDRDRDGMGDACDGDADADLVPDEVDNCRLVVNPQQEDLDGDGVGDVCDDDLDGDGAPNDVEVAAGTNPRDPDTDGDFISDGEELFDQYGFLVDTDGDRIIDALDADSDNDGVPDALEAGDEDLLTPARDSDGDGVPDFRTNDGDGDGVLDGDDNCRSVRNPAQSDLDGDGQGDACEDDVDGDGLKDADELRLGLDPFNPDSDGDGISDGDEVGDPLHPYDSDDDGLIDAHDLDSDGDGIPDSKEAGPGARPLDTDGDGVPDFRDKDSDGDGIDDGIDVCRLVKDPLQGDRNGDGIGDLCELDQDGDGVPNAMDNCVSVPNPDQADLDFDGVGDACDSDLDGDGHPDDVDVCPRVSDPQQDDADGDGQGDACETDDDLSLWGGCASASPGAASLLLALMSLRRRRRR